MLKFPNSIQLKQKQKTKNEPQTGVNGNPCK